MNPEQIVITAPDEISATYGAGDPETEEDLDALAHGGKALYQGMSSESEREETDKPMVDLNSSPLVRFVNRILEKARAMCASDIHIEPQ